MTEQRIIGKEETEEETQILNECQKLLDKVDLDLKSTKPKPRP